MPPSDADGFDGRRPRDPQFGLVSEHPPRPPASTDGRRRRAPRAEVLAVTGAVVLSVAGVLTAIALYPRPLPETLGVALAQGGFLPVVLSGIGAFIVLRRPGNRIGRLLATAGALFAPQLVLDVLAETPAADPAAAPVWLALPLDWTWAPGALITLYLVPLHFPDGRLPSPRWRPLLWLILLTFLAMVAATVLAPGPMWPVPADNPFGLQLLEPAMPLLNGLLVVMLALLLGAVAISLAVRYAHAPPIQRQQLKIMLFPLPFIVGLILLGPFVPALAPLLAAGGYLLIAMVPVGIAVAVLRYGLYEIDRIISRAVSYAFLTATLAGIYVAGVMGFGSAVRTVTGDGGGDLVVAASTLAVAAAFGPLRHRIQALVDQRFNRARYDAARTIEAFVQRLRDEFELHLIGADLVRVTRDALSPSAVSLWLQPGASSVDRDRDDGSGVLPGPHRDDGSRVPRTASLSTARSRAVDARR